jgi:uncharacterized protein
MTTAPLDLGLAFAAGLLGSGHCLGMCGALVSGCFLRLGAAARSASSHAAYHTGRVAVYAVAGAVAAGLGRVLPLTGRFGLAQGVLQIVAGVLVILLGLDILGKFSLPLAARIAPLDWPRRLLDVALHRGAVRGALLAGVANGLMPCSLTLAMVVKAGATADPAHGTLLMLAFGAGTLPAMATLGALSVRLGAATRSRLVAGGALMVIAMGALLVVQGVAYVRVMSLL